MSERSLRECLLESTDDLDSIVKQILEFLLERDKKKLCDENISSLVNLFDAKQQQIKEYLSKVEEYQNREKLIRELEQCVENKNGIIMRVEAELKGAEIALTAAVFQANKKVKSVLESEMRPINSEEIVRVAHQISRNYSVAAPLFWQQGDSTRPFPTENEFRNSHLAAPRSLHTVPPILMRPQPPFSSQVRTPPQPGMPAGRVNQSPMGGGGGYGQPMQRSWSPRTGYGPVPSSPRSRGGMQSTPGGGRGGQMMSGVSPFGRRPSTNESPKLASPTVNFTSPPPRTMPPPVSNVEQMSSDSSSSSSSDDESPR